MRHHQLTYIIAQLKYVHIKPHILYVFYLFSPVFLGIIWFLTPHKVHLSRFSTVKCQSSWLMSGTAVSLMC